MNYDNPDLLIAQLRKGDEKAYIPIIDQHNKRLFGYALSLTSFPTSSQRISLMILKLDRRRVPS